MTINQSVPTEVTHRSLKQAVIDTLALSTIAIHLLLQFGVGFSSSISNLPLYVTLLFGGGALVWELLVKMSRREFGFDLLAGISIVTSVLLGEYLAGTLVVLMLSGGRVLKAYAVGRASSALQALGKRMPSVAHRKEGALTVDVGLEDLLIGDEVRAFPHELCPVDGTVTEGHSTMDESYLTGEPYLISKTPGSTVLSGAINGDSAFCQLRSWSRRFMVLATHNLKLIPSSEDRVCPLVAIIFIVDLSRSTRAISEFLSECLKIPYSRRGVCSGPTLFHCLGHVGVCRVISKQVIKLGKCQVPRNQERDRRSIGQLWLGSALIHGLASLEPIWSSSNGS